jgi:ClpP class serine protease
MAASGGYWIASAADRVVISELAVLGSIGVVLGVEDRSGADERRGVRKVEIVSSQSPGKRPDVNTEEGRTQIQTMVDDLAEVFVSAVAKHRGVSSEDVISKFGAGGVKVGAKAVASGMADEVGQFEAVLASLSPSGKGRYNPRGAFIMANDENHNGPTAEEIAAKATADAQARIKAIVSSDMGKAMPTLASHLAYDTPTSSEAAVKIMEAAKADIPENKPEAADEQPQGKTYEQQKAEAGALGLGQPQGTNASAPKVDPFAKAVANHNRKFA